MGQRLLLPGDTPVSAQPEAEAEGKYLPGSSPRPPSGSTLPAPLLKGITHKGAFSPSWFSLEQRLEEQKLQAGSHWSRKFRKVLQIAGDRHTQVALSGQTRGCMWIDWCLDSFCGV